MLAVSHHPSSQCLYYLLIISHIFNEHLNIYSNRRDRMWFCSAPSVLPYSPPSKLVKPLFALIYSLSLLILPASLCASLHLTPRVISVDRLAYSVQHLYAQTHTHALKVRILCYLLIFLLLFLQKWVTL